MLYHYARRYDDIPGVDPEAGSTARGAMKAWYKNGACSHDQWPNVEPDNNNKWQQDAFSRPLGAYFRVNHSELADMHAAINETKAVYATATIHEGWKRVNKENPTISCSEDDGVLGGHAFLIIGYDQVGFWIQNSWGDDWGHGGYARLTYSDWDAHGMDAWVAQLGINVEHQAKNIRDGLDFSRLKEGTSPIELLSTNPEVTRQIINPYIIDLQNNGFLSDSGNYHTNAEDVDLLITRYLPNAIEQWGLGPDEPIELAMYAHGGLTSESDAAKLAETWIRNLYAKKIFPIFFMWETGKMETLNDMWDDWWHKQRAAGLGLIEMVGDIWNRRMESILAPLGTPMWDEMKKNAQAASDNHQGGIAILYRSMVRNMDPGIKKRLRLHLIGHSAGSIFHAYLLQKLLDHGVCVDGIYFMAPAIRQDLFEEKIYPAYKSGSVAHYTQFHLTDECELGDNCYPLPYKHSLLYLVSNSFEGVRQTPILGVKKFFENSGLTSLNANVIVAPTTSDAPQGQQSSSSSHGGFGSNLPTVDSILWQIDQRRKQPLRVARAAGNGAGNGAANGLREKAVDLVGSLRHVLEQLAQRDAGNGVTKEAIGLTDSLQQALDRLQERNN